MLDHLKIDKAHFVGLSMGGFTTIVIGLTYPQRALSLNAAGVGSGSERAHLVEFRKNALQTAGESKPRARPRWRAPMGWARRVFRSW